MGFHNKRTKYLLVILAVAIIAIYHQQTYQTFAADEQTEVLSYTQPFQEQTATLSGQSVSTNMYFIKMDYWNVKKATLNLNFQLSQLTDSQISDLTFSINGTKFYSYRPEQVTGLQTKAIDIPVKLLTGNSELRIEGQVLNKAGSSDYRLSQTPANWLTIYSASNVNFSYTLDPPTTKINSFYDHFVGPDTIANAQSAIVTPKNPTDSELTAATYALSGISRTITTELQMIPIGQATDPTLNQRQYQVIIAKYKNLPTKYQKQINVKDIQDQGIIKFVQDDDGYRLIVTAQTDALLIKASRFVANKELMKQSDLSQVVVSKTSQTFTSEMQYDGSFQLTTSGQKVTGAGHQEASFFVSLPIDRTNANGSTISLNLQYSDNLDFKRSLVTVYVNNQVVGSRKLTASESDGNKLTFKLPNNKSLGNSFVVRVAFDLELPENKVSDNTNLAWANVMSNSNANIVSQVNHNILFSNYPSLFLKNSAFNQIAIIRPKRMTAEYFKTLSNIFNLLGCYAQNNTGTIQFYTNTPSEKVLAGQNIIAFGTPNDNRYLRQLNSKLYFQYDKKYTHFLSNEKLSIEPNYGKNLGSAQLLRSATNSKLAVLAVTAPTATGVYLASTQLNFQRNIDQYDGDTILVDSDNTHFGYRFKKKASTQSTNTVTKQLKAHIDLIIYLGLAVLLIIVIGVTLFLLLRKHGLAGGNQNEK